MCPTQHWLWSCLLHASQAPNRRTGTQWGCFRNNRGCLAYDAIAFRACAMRHVYLSRSVKKCWKRRENRGFCLRESRVGGRRFLHTCKSGVARESLLRDASACPSACRRALPGGSRCTPVILLRNRHHRGAESRFAAHDREGAVELFQQHQTDKLVVHRQVREP